MKRAFDIIVSLVVLIALSPVLVGIALAIRRLSGRPVFFRQMRSGLNGRPFELVKFRTMSNLADPTDSPLPDENRSEPFGQFLRSTSLDELPELWNVLKGDMSIVGPPPPPHGVYSPVFRNAGTAPRGTSRYYRLGASEWAHQHQLEGKIRSVNVGAKMHRFAGAIIRH